MTVKWTKEDVIKAVEDALAGSNGKRTSLGQQLREKIQTLRGKTEVKR